MDVDSSEWRLETIDDEAIDTGKRDLNAETFSIDDIDFFADTSPDKEN
jgi:hypothetical protein